MKDIHDVVQDKGRFVSSALTSLHYHCGAKHYFMSMSLLHYCMITILSFLEKCSLERRDKSFCVEYYHKANHSFIMQTAIKAKT